VISVVGLSPNAAYWRLLHLAAFGSLPVAHSRIGDIVDLGHVSVELDQGERLCMLQSRGINPAFALVEAAWLLMGRNDLSPLQSILRNYGQYSDDGVTLNGAYGCRLRKHFGVDQIELAIDTLRKNADTRRVVLTLYEVADLGKDSKDIPCNTQVVLRIEDGRLAMTVFNRSNDLWLGVPYNWFVFRVLQSFIANELGLDAGFQRHVSTCMHLYTKDILAARRVVATNSLESIAQFEQATVPLNLATVIADAPGLSIAQFDNLRSEELTRFFRRFKAASHTAIIHEASEASCNVDPRLGPRGALDVALSNWLSVKIPTKESALSTNVSQSSAHIAVRTAIQNWALAGGGDRQRMVEELDVAAMNLRPFLQTLLSRDLPIGVHAQLDDPNSLSVCRHLVLEIVLGCLDPLLSSAPLGIALRTNLEEMAKAAGLPPQPIKGREAAEDVLLAVFGHVLH